MTAVWRLVTATVPRCHSQKTAPRAYEIKAVFSGISAELGRRPQTANIVKSRA